MNDVENANNALSKETPKLFASSHYSQKLMKNCPFVLKKAVSLARFEQDPMNEVLNLWSPITAENQALALNLDPMQKLVNQARLADGLDSRGEGGSGMHILAQVAQLAPPTAAKDGQQDQQQKNVQTY